MNNSEQLSRRAETLYWKIRQGVRTGALTHEEARRLHARVETIMRRTGASQALADDSAVRYELWIHLPFQAAHVFKHVTFDEVRRILGRTLYRLSHDGDEDATSPLAEWSDYCMVELIGPNGQREKAAIEREYGSWHVVGLTDPETGREEMIPMLMPNDEYKRVADDDGMTSAMQRLTTRMATSSDDERRERLRVKYTALIVTLRRAAEMMPETFDSAFMAEIDPMLSDIARLIGAEHVSIRVAETQKGVYPPAYPSSSLPDETAEPAAAEVQGSGIFAPLENIHTIDVAAMVRGRARQEIMSEAQAKSNEASVQLDALKEPPAGWMGTKKDYLERNARTIAELRMTRDRNDALYRAVRDNTDDEEARRRVEARIAEIMRDPSEIEASKAPRLAQLMARAFEEESSDENFYPTPEDVIEQYIIAPMREHFSATDTFTVLEPSAGKGNIADAIRSAFPNAQIDVGEINNLRREILALKGYNIVSEDFLAFAAKSSNYGRYDVVAMNPPFNRGVGMAHVMKAANLVRQDGYLYAVLPESNVFGENKEAVYFQDKMTKLGTVTKNAITAADYNRNHERKILINIGVLELHKNKATGYGKSDGIGAREAIKGFRTRTAIDKTPREADKDFVAPDIITARQDITKPATIDVILPKYRAMPFLKNYVFEGVNKAVESIDAVGGFLLADGTGTGKTIQSLLVAEHVWRTTGKPVLIFTVDDRVVQTSFFDDAKKLGFNVPDRIDIESVRKPMRPKKYQGLYDGGEEVAVPTVYRHTFGLPLRDGIGVCTYHDLSQFKGLESYKAVIAEKQARVSEVRREHAQARKEAEKTLDAIYPKDSNGKRKKKGYKEAKEHEMLRLHEQYMIENPAHRELYLAQEAYRAAAEDAVAGFAGDTQLIIFDEAHKVKNAGDGIDQQNLPLRALLGMVLINRCPRIMYVTATPADRAFDVLYLKKTRLWRDDEEYRRTMQSIGYEYKDAVLNKAGDIVIGARWTKSNTMDEYDLSRSNETMRRLFERITEDGQMLRREIQLTNLTVKMNKFAAPPEALAEMDNIMDAYTVEDENGRERVDWMQVYRAQMEALELYKIPKALELVDKAVARGRQVIVFGYTTEEGTEERSGTGTTKIGTVEIIKRTLDERYGADNVGVIIGTKNEYEDYRRLENVREFQSGDRPILIGTITSGGTGLNLDDTTGTRPRTLIIITPPMSFINVMQGLGRIVRANTQSRSEAEFIFTDNTAVDEWMSRIMATKFATLAATVEGETSRLDPDQVAATDNTGEEGSVSLIAAATEPEAPSVMMHPLFKKKNFEVNGWELVDNIPMWVSVTGTPMNTLVAIGGRTRENLEQWRINNEKLIADHNLKINPDESLRRFHGSYYGREWRYGRDSDGYRDLVQALLNVVDPKILVADAGVESFKEGQEVRFAESVQWAQVQAGTTGRITRIRRARIKGQPPFYDVEIPGGRIVNSVNQTSLQNVGISSSPLDNKYHVGQSFTAPSESYSSRTNERAVIKSISGYDVELEYSYTSKYGRYVANSYWEPAEASETVSLDIAQLAEWLEAHDFTPATDTATENYPKVADR